MKTDLRHLTIAFAALGFAFCSYAGDQPPPAAWSFVAGAISTERCAGEDAFRFVHTGTKNWSVTTTKAQGAAYGERYSLKFETEAVDGATNEFRAGVVLSQIGGKVINWAFAERVLKPGEKVNLEFVVTERNAAISTRLRGWGPVAAKVRNFRLERLGHVPLDPKGNIAIFDGDIGMALPDRGGFFIRDVARAGDYRPIKDEADGVRLTTRKESANITDITLEDLTGRDRAITFVYALPLDDGEITCYGNARTGTVVRSGEWSESVAMGKAGKGRMAHSPFLAVGIGENGYALGFDPSAPAFGRIAVNASTRQLYVAFDIGLAPEKKTANFHIVSFRFDRSQGFRGALSAYREIFPEAFRVRCRKQGTWTVTDRLAGKLPHPEDFGFRIRGRMGETNWDDRMGFLTFRYTEPCTWWVKVAKAIKGEYTLADGFAEVERLKATGDRRAKIFNASVMEDAQGRPVGRLRRDSWCQGVVWALNSAPGINGGVNNDFTAKIAPDEFDNRYAKPFPEGLDGEYLDSIELYVTPECDYARSHFAGMKTPLTFERDSKRPVIFSGLVTYEYTREVSRLTHARNRLMLSNCTPIKLWWLAPYIDVLGSEVWWVKENRQTGETVWKPMTDGEFTYRRALAGGKPICFLMDAPFDKFTESMTEKYFTRCLAYGCYPSFFTWHGVNTYAKNLYYLRPDCYERDRHLFKKYIPICREIAEAGWQPINRLVESDSESVITEQFGSLKASTAFATVFNLSEKTETVHLRVKEKGHFEERLTGEVLNPKNGTIELTLPGETCRVIRWRHTREK